MEDPPGLGAGEAVGVDVGHDLVAADLLPAGGDRKVDGVGLALQLLDLLGSDGEAQLPLGFGQGDPEGAPGAHPVRLGEEAAHFPAGVAGGQLALVGAVFHYDRPLSMYCSLSGPTDR